MHFLYSNISKRTGKEAAVSEYYSSIYLVCAKKTNKNLSTACVSAEIQTGTPQIQVRSVTTWANLLGLILDA